MAELVIAYDRLGRASLIPSNWIGHPTLGGGWSLTPPAQSEPQTPPESPVETPKRAPKGPAETPHGGEKE